MTLETSPCSSNIFHSLIPVSGLFPGTPGIAIWRGILGHVFKKWLKEIWRHGNSLLLSWLTRGGVKKVRTARGKQRFDSLDKVQ